MRAIPTLVLAGALVLAPSAPALGQARDVTNVSLSDEVVDPGDRLVVRGENWAPRSRVTIRLASGPPIGVSTVDPTGRFSRSVRIPEDVQEGRQEVRVSGRDDGGSPLTLTIGVEVTSSRLGGLPITVLVALVFAALIVIAAILVLGRFRRGAGQPRSESI